MVIAAVLFAISATRLRARRRALTYWRVIGGLAVGAASVDRAGRTSPRWHRRRPGAARFAAAARHRHRHLRVPAESTDAIAQSAGGSASDDVPWGGTAWRWMFIRAAIPAAIYGMLALQIPESPRVPGEGPPPLAGGRGGRADQVQRWRCGALCSATSSDFAGERPRQGAGAGPDGGPAVRPDADACWVGILLSVFQQFVGINVIFYYSTTLSAGGRARG